MHCIRFHGSYPITEYDNAEKAYNINLYINLIILNVHVIML